MTAAIGPGFHVSHLSTRHPIAVASNTARLTLAPEVVSWPGISPVGAWTRDALVTSLRNLAMQGHLSKAVRGCRFVTYRHGRPVYCSAKGVFGPRCTHCSRRRTIICRTFGGDFSSEPARAKRARCRRRTVRAGPRGLGKLSRTIMLFLYVAPPSTGTFVRRRAASGASGSPKRASAEAGVLQAADLNKAGLTPLGAENGLASSRLMK